MRILIGKYEASIYPEGRGYTGAISLGFYPDGKRKRIKRKGRTKEEVKDKLRKAAEELEKGIKTDSKYTVAQCVNDFLARGLSGRCATTHKQYRVVADNQIIPKIGRIKLKDLTVDHVDEWLEKLAKEWSTQTVATAHSILTRSIRMARRRGKIDRNVSSLVDTPKGQKGRPSKSLSLEQATKLIAASQNPKWRLGAYVILSLTSGLRTEEARMLTWSNVDLDNATIYVLRSDRDGGDTKTKKSRRGLKIAQIAVTALRVHKTRQAAERLLAGEAWQDNDLVFCYEDGTRLGPHYVNRQFKKIAKAAGIGDEWVPRELRHTFVSLLSDHGVPTQKIADLVGHSGTATTETVYRHQLRPVITEGAEAMDQIFKIRSA